MKLSRTVWDRLIFAALLLATLILFLDHVSLALEKSYNDDEFQYAHGAWLISQGEVIYRDFFEHHLPLTHQLMAGVLWLVGDQHPASILAMRFAMLPFLLAMMLAAWRLNAGGGWGAAGALAVLMLPTLSVMAVEVRPDPIACSLFLWAIAVHTFPSLSLRVRGFLSGFLAIAALWGTLKVAYYGMVLPLALVADLWMRRRGEDADEEPRTPLLSDPWMFLLGGAAAGLPIVLYLTATGTWDDVFDWTIRWSFVHQWHYPGFPWVRNAVPLLAQSFWVLPFAAIGVAATVKRLRGAERREGAEILLLAALGTSLASVAWQSAAYLYSFVPLAALLAIFAARGAVAAFQFFAAQEKQTRVFAMLVLATVLMMEVQRARTAIGKLRAANNSAQHEVWNLVDALTRPDEPVYHLMGGQITRPSVHYFYFLEAVTRKLKHKVYVEEYARAMIDTGCVAYLWSDRFNRLAFPLQQFLLDNYQAMTRDLWFWGRSYQPGTDRFWAIRDGSYFIWPLAAAGDLQVDGEAVDSIFELTRGDHRVEYVGDLPEIHLVLFPADGKPFPPRPEQEPAASPPPGF